MKIAAEKKVEKSILANNKSFVTSPKALSTPSPSKAYLSELNYKLRSKLGKIATSDKFNYIEEELEIE